MINNQYTNDGLNSTAMQHGIKCNNKIFTIEIFCQQNLCFQLYGFRKHGVVVVYHILQIIQGEKYGSIHNHETFPVK